MNRQNDYAKTLIETWEALVRYRWRFVLTAFGVTAGVLIGSFMLPRKYKAEALFDRHTDMVLTEMMDQGGSRSFLESQRLSLVEEISGQIAIDDMIKTIQTSPKLTGRLQNIELLNEPGFRAELSRRVTVRFEIGTREFDRVRVEFMHDDRDLASVVVNTLVENYIAKTRKTIDGRLRQTAKFFQSEVDRNRRLIESLENKKLTFEIDHGELLPDNPGSVQLRMTEAQNELNKLLQERDAAAMRIDALRQMADTSPQTLPRVITMRNPQIDLLEGKMREFKSKMDVYVNTYKMTEKHPDLVALKEQMAATELEIQSTPAEIVTQKQVGANPNRENIEMHLSQDTASLQAIDKQAESLRDLISKLSMQSSNLFPIRSDYRKLTRRIEQLQRQQTFWEENLRRIEMALTAESGNRGIRLSFVRPSEPAAKPVSPDLVQVLLVAIALGLGSGGISTFFAYRTDESFRTGEQLAEAMSIPLLGAVSEIISQRQQVERRVRNMILYPLNTSAMAAVLAILVGLLYLNLEKPLLFEQFKQNPAAFIYQRIGAPAQPANVGKE